MRLVNCWGVLAQKGNVLGTLLVNLFGGDQKAYPFRVTHCPASEQRRRELLCPAAEGIAVAPSDSRTCIASLGW